MTGKRVAFYFIAFFGLIAAMNAVMVSLALRTHSGIVTEHPYEKGLAYNRVVKAEAAQQALGWHSTLEYIPNSSQELGMYPSKARRAAGGLGACPQRTQCKESKNGVLHFQVKDAEGRPLHPQKAEAHFTRPTEQGVDFALPLTGGQAAVTFPAQGLWHATIDTQIEGKAYQHSARLVVK